MGGGGHHHHRHLHWPPDLHHQHRQYGGIQGTRHRLHHTKRRVEVRAQTWRDARQRVRELERLVSDHYLSEDYVNDESTRLALQGARMEELEARDSLTHAKNRLKSLIAHRRRSQHRRSQRRRDRK